MLLLYLQYTNTLSLEKEIIVLEKVFNFASENMYEPWFTLFLHGFDFCFGLREGIWSDYIYLLYI